MEANEKSLKYVELLLIEDNPGDVVLIREAVKMCPFPVRISHAADGEQGLALLINEGSTADLIILDLNLPKLTGPEILERFLPTAPVVVFSSTGDVGPDAHRALKLGARECVRKPPDFDGFVQAVCQLITKWAPEKTARDTRV